MRSIILWTFQWSWVTCRSSTGLHCHRYYCPIQAYARLQCLAPNGLGCIWIACRAICHWGLVLFLFCSLGYSSCEAMLIDSLPLNLILQTGTHPKITTLRNINRFRAQVIHLPTLSVVLVGVLIKIVEDMVLIFSCFCKMFHMVIWMCPNSQLCSHLLYYVTLLAHFWPIFPRIAFLLHMAVSKCNLILVNSSFWSFRFRVGNRTDFFKHMLDVKDYIFKDFLSFGDQTWTNFNF